MCIHCSVDAGLASKEVCMRLTFSGYTGDKSKLTADNLKCLTPSEDVWVDVPLSAAQKRRKKHTVGLENLRDILYTTYPGVRYLHELATESIKCIRPWVIILFPELCAN